MAEEKERPTRGRKKTTTEATAKKAAPKPKSAKPAATKAKTTAKGRKTVAVAAAAPTSEAIAEHAYLLWERGEPGDQTTHWLRAEAELRAA